VKKRKGLLWLQRSGQVVGHPDSPTTRETRVLGKLKGGLRSPTGKRYQGQLLKETTPVRKWNKSGGLAHVVQRDTHTA